MSQPWDEICSLMALHKPIGMLAVSCFPFLAPTQRRRGRCYSLESPKLWDGEGGENVLVILLIFSLPRYYSLCSQPRAQHGNTALTSPSPLSLKLNIPVLVTQRWLRRRKTLPAEAKSIIARLHVSPNCGDWGVQVWHGTEILLDRWLAAAPCKVCGWSSSFRGGRNLLTTLTQRILQCFDHLISQA